MQRINIYTDVGIRFVKGYGSYLAGFGSNSYYEDVTFGGENEIDDINIDDTIVSDTVRTLADDFVEYLKEMDYPIVNYENNSTNTVMEVTIDVEPNLDESGMFNLTSDAESFFFDTQHDTEMEFDGNTTISYNQTDVDEWDYADVDVDCIYELDFDTELEIKEIEI